MLSKSLTALAAGVLWLGLASGATGGTAGGGSSIEGLVVDPSGAVVAGASVKIGNPVVGTTRTASTDATGAFRFQDVPPNPYRLEVSALGFAVYRQDISVRGLVPLTLRIPLVIAGGETTMNVESSTDLVENVPYAHNDFDREAYAKLPLGSPGSGLSDAITLTTPGVVADSNGFFHPLGDHAQVTFSVDGQPISDQQSKQFSTQIPTNAIQSMEIISGAPPAEFGDKTSLVINAMTRSGLGQSKPTGSFETSYGSFGTLSEETTLALGGPKFGNFLALNALRSGRFLDTPELFPMHAIGNNETFFDRADWQPTGKGTFHLNVFLARNWFQVPATYDQPLQDQRQKVATIDIAPGYQRTLGTGTLLTVSTFFRRDRAGYYPSRDPFDDTPVTIGQARSLTNWGLRSDVSAVRGKHNLKLGVQLMQTRLGENFQLGVTDPVFNPVCLDQSGNPQALPGVTDPSLCAGLGFTANPNLNPGLVPFDLTRGGSLFQFTGKANIDQAALYAQDSMTLGNLTVVAGLRLDRYDGLSQATGIEPRLGLSYLLKPANLVLRTAYSRTLETPFNENLILSSATGNGGLATNVFGAYASQPLQSGRRNQFNAGLQRGIGRLLQVDADYFWKFTSNAFDFDTLFNTPITFPISWRESKNDGVSVRVGSTNWRGFQISTTMGHTRARYFGPSNGGLIFNSPLDTGVFRIDHDQAFQQTTYMRYQRPHNGPWVGFTWRFDSGLVAGSVPDLASALALTADQQAAIGFYCGGQQATLSSPIASCSSSNYGATRLVIPAPGIFDPDHNPPRIAPRNIFDLGAGTDNLFHAERWRTTLKVTVMNLANTVALYNFLSTFSGTHFVAPRTVQVALGIAF